MTKPESVGLITVVKNRLLFFWDVFLLIISFFHQMVQIAYVTQSYIYGIMCYLLVDFECFSWFFYSLEVVSQVYFGSVSFFRS